MIYVAYLHDRHVDPVIRASSDRHAAIEAARTFMRENMAHPENVKQEAVDGYEIYLGYSESDHAFVVAVELKQPSE